MHEQHLDRLRQAAEPVVSAVSGPLLVVDDHGWVAHHAGISGRDRIEVPRVNRALAVPGLGLCLPERIGDGWLVRPREARAEITARLDLSSPPVLELRSDREPWRVSLTRRHAEILELLGRAGPAGLSASAISTTIFGDAEHAITVRADA